MACGGGVEVDIEGGMWRVEVDIEGGMRWILRVVCGEGRGGY